jgi:hypothetical protein
MQSIENENERDTVRGYEVLRTGFVRLMHPLSMHE